MTQPRRLPTDHDVPYGGWTPYHDFHYERIRAYEKHGPSDDSVELWDWDDPRWLPVLVEEIGEAACELNELHLGSLICATCAKARARLRAELVQVGAMVAAWVDALDEASE